MSTKLRPEDVIQMALSGNSDFLTKQSEYKSQRATRQAALKPSVVIGQGLQELGGPDPSVGAMYGGGEGSGRPGPENAPQHLAGLDPDLQWVIMKESSGNTSAKNPTSSAFGLGQLIKSNRESYGKRFGFDPNTTDFSQQLQMMDAYIKERYGSYKKARDFWEKNNWY